MEPVWDAVVIGAGMGGGFTARSLAEAGYRVLLVDRGYSEPHGGPETGSPESALAECRWPTEIACEVDGEITRHFGIVGCGVGGSTNFYAGALERFDRHDVDTHPQHPHPTGGWPITYDELLPYYEEAERMLHVAGTRDPLDPERFEHLQQPPDLGPADTQFVQSFEKCGLHPYRLHVGIRYLPGCDECLTGLCKIKNCRADARSAVAEARIQPTVMDRTEAVRLVASHDKVSTAILRRDGQEIAVSARVFVLAAGAIHTPRLLLKSSGEDWPDGLANRSGMVGRNLMFHSTLRFAMWPSKGLPGSGPRKSISFRDFYFFQGERLGSVQSSGFSAGYGDLLMHLYDTFDRGMLRWLGVARPFLRLPAALTIRLRGQGTIFACCLEDLPYPDNRVAIDSNEPDGVLMKYNIRQELRDRSSRFEAVLEKHLAGQRMAFLTRGVNLNLSHACGTCTMGRDPKTSVIDRDCRAHGIGNLYVTDASFMPTSAAINPSLTIAANALRVSESIKRALAGELQTELIGR